MNSGKNIYHILKRKKQEFKKKQQINVMETGFEQSSSKSGFRKVKYKRAWGDFWKKALIFKNKKAWLHDFITEILTYTVYFMEHDSISS